MKQDATTRRFDSLLVAMIDGPKPEKKPSAGSASDPAASEDCDETQTHTDTSAVLGSKHTKYGDVSRLSNALGNRG